MIYSDTRFKYMDPNSTKSQVLSFSWETIKVVVISLAIIIPIRYYLVQPFYVKGASMEPSYEDGDYLLVDELTYRLREPERGEVIVFRYPEDPSQFFIKRIIGLPEETVEIKNNRVIVYNKENPSGHILLEGYLSSDQETLGNMIMKLDDNDYFVLGDNRLHSSDSRRWGAINKTSIRGRALLRPWPLDRASRLTSPEYGF